MSRRILSSFGMEFRPLKNKATPSSSSSIVQSFISSFHMLGFFFNKMFIASFTGMSISCADRKSTRLNSSHDDISYAVVTGVQTCALPICTRNGHTSKGGNEHLIKEESQHVEGRDEGLDDGTTRRRRCFIFQRTELHSKRR